MSVRLEGAIIHLRAPCLLEDAEPLTSLLLAGPDRCVDLSQAGDLHTAALQVLLALRPALAGDVGDAFTRHWLQPLLARAARTADSG